MLDARMDSLTSLARGIVLVALVVGSNLPAAQEYVPRTTAIEVRETAADVQRLSFDDPARALELADDALRRLAEVRPSQLAQLRLARGEALARAGRFDQALTAFEELEAAELEPRQEARLALRRAGMLIMLARVDEGRAWLERAAPLVDAHGGHDERAGLHGTRGVLLQTEARFEEALGLYRQALEEAKASGDRRLEALYLYNIGTVQAAVGDNVGACRSIDHALDLGLGRGHQRAMLLTARAGLAHATGDKQEARDMFAEALTIQREIGSLGGEALIERKLGDLELEAEHPEAALPHYERSLALTRAGGNREALASSLVALADVGLDAGRNEAARAWAEEAHALASQLGMPVVQQHVLLTLSRVLARAGEFERALALHREYADVTAQFEAQARSAALERLQGEHRLELERRDRANAVAHEQRSRNLALAGSGVLALAALLLVRSLRQKSRLARGLTHRNDEIQAASAHLAQLNRDLERALADVRLLTGLLPICAHCKSIRDESGHWQPLESYFSDHSDARFSHGICPGCLRTHHPELEPPIGRG